METSTLDDLMALNDQLVALAEAGVPIDLGSGDRDLVRTLEGASALVARSVSRGASLQEAIERDPMLPAWYRCLVLVGLRSGDMGAALDASHGVAASVEQSRETVSSAFFYPLIVCAMAYVGMIGFCMFFVPTLERTYDSFDLEPGHVLKILLGVRDTLPYWIAVPPLLLLVLVWRSRRKKPAAGSRSGRLFDRLPGASRSVSDARWASFAETLAVLEQSGVPVNEAVPLAACACGDARLQEAGTAAATDLEKGKRTSDDSAAAQRFPPFLRWAMLDSGATIGRARALEMAGRVYRDSAERRAARSRIVTPMVVVVLLGGSVTLLYALAVFVPVIDLLWALSS